MNGTVNDERNRVNLHDRIAALRHRLEKENDREGLLALSRAADLAQEGNVVEARALLDSLTESTEPQPEPASKTDLASVAKVLAERPGRRGVRGMPGKAGPQGLPGLPGPGTELQPDQVVPDGMFAGLTYLNPVSTEQLLGRDWRIGDVLVIPKKGPQVQFENERKPTPLGTRWACTRGGSGPGFKRILDDKPPVVLDGTLIDGGHVILQRWRPGETTIDIPEGARILLNGAPFVAIRGSHWVDWASTVDAVLPYGGNRGSVPFADGTRANFVTREAS